jgi:hypothetical protein
MKEIKTDQRWSEGLHEVQVTNAFGVRIKSAEVVPRPMRKSLRMISVNALRSWPIGNCEYPVLVQQGGERQQTLMASSLFRGSPIQCLYPLL